MKFDELLERFHGEALFDLASVALFFPEGDQTLAVSLHRLRRAGKIVQLRRGLYAFAEPYRTKALTGPMVAEALYQPSYLSERWALSWYGVIPEKTVMYTSACTRSTRRFENEFGVFAYRSLKLDLFFGYRSETIMGAPIRIASPEKALVDLWYLEPGEWTGERMESMRLESGAIDSALLVEAAEATNSPRLRRASQAWLRYAESQTEGRILI